MVAPNLEPGLRFVLKEEGGNDDDPHDHGGRTSRGITQKEWNSWIESHPGNSWPADVWSAPQDQIDAIYKEQYWEPYCDRMPSGVDVEFFDACVNTGRTQAVKTLQKSLGVGVDGMMGIITWTAIESVDQHALVLAFAENRRSLYQALAQYPRYGKGWIGRTDRCEQFATTLVTAPAIPKPAPVPSIKPSPKANPSDIKKPPINPEGGTAGSGGILFILSEFRDQLEKLTWLPHLDYIIAGIAAAVFLISLYGFWHRSQMQEQVG